ncbi:hypothetical protein PS057_21285, partial [Yersinia pestis]|nr:hypothetical protein [Yersinia pestis]
NGATKLCPIVHISVKLEFVSLVANCKVALGHSGLCGLKIHLVASHLPTCQGLSGATMKSFILILCLAQLWGGHSAPHGPGLGYREPDCDDPETEQAALAAVDHINRHLLQGFRHILNQIDKVKVWARRPFGEVFELEIDTLETTCHVLDPTPLANCPVRQVAQHAVEGDCDVHVLKLDGKFTVLTAKCHSTPDSAEDVRKVCPACPLLARLNDTRVVHAAEVALAAFNAQNNGSYYQLL